MIKPQLIFGFYGNHFEKDKFKTGTLVLVSQFGNLKFMATSGLLHHQGIGSCNKKGRGGIPPCNLVDIQGYKVCTRPIFMPRTRGVEGNFYRILPFEVVVDQYGRKTKRRDFGIHADKNIRGTAGCIGIPPGEHWVKFEEEIEKIAGQGIEMIDLFVPSN